MKRLGLLLRRLNWWIKRKTGDTKTRHENYIGRKVGKARLHWQTTSVFAEQFTGREAEQGLSPINDGIPSRPTPISSITSDWGFPFSSTFLDLIEDFGVQIRIKGGYQSLSGCSTHSNCLEDGRGEINAPLFYTMKCGGSSRWTFYPSQIGLIPNHQPLMDGMFAWARRKTRTKNVDSRCTRQPAPLPTALPCAQAEYTDHFDSLCPFTTTGPSPTQRKWPELRQKFQQFNKRHCWEKEFFSSSNIPCDDIRFGECQILLLCMQTLIHTRTTMYAISQQKKSDFSRQTAHFWNKTKHLQKNQIGCLRNQTRHILRRLKS